jgi:hypothetical protein
VVEAISVSGSQVTGSGSSTITVNPTDDLAYSTEYYVLIDATAFDDASSNSYTGISDTTALSFTTATVAGAPTALAGSRIGQGGIALTWTAPSSNGGAAISDYIIEYSTDETTWTNFSDGASSTASATVTGLENSTAYTFRVSAVNAAGTGTASATTNGTTATTPDAPTSLIVFGGIVAHIEIYLQWTAPASNGGAATDDYIVEYSTDSGETWVAVSFVEAGGDIACIPNIPDPEQCSFLLDGLVPETPYTIRVSAVNSVGTGSPSDSLNVTTTEA